MSEENLPKVWVVVAGKHDFTAASKFGIITPIFQGSVVVFNNGKTVIDDMTRVLDEHAKEGDYLVQAGVTFLTMAAGHYFMKRFGRVNCLLYNSKKNEYRAMTVYDFPINGK